MGWSLFTLASTFTSRKVWEGEGGDASACKRVQMRACAHEAAEAAAFPTLTATHPSQHCHRHAHQRMQAASQALPPHLCGVISQPTEKHSRQRSKSWHTAHFTLGCEEMSLWQ